MPVEDYSRVLVKISGEALAGSSKQGFDAAVVDFVVKEIGDLRDDGIEIALVIGGGNFYRGNVFAAGAEIELPPSTADQIGMLGTFINALTVRDSLIKCGWDAKIVSKHPIEGVSETFLASKARKNLRNTVVICAGGTGNPLFTTDTAACLFGIELDVDLVLKATKVDGVYDADPEKDRDAVRFDVLTYNDVIQNDLQVMDLPAITLARDYQLPIVVYRMLDAGALRRIIRGGKGGTLVSS